MSTPLYSCEHPSISNGLWGLRHKVADIDRATEFYVQHLGFRLDHQTPTHIRQLSSGGLKLTLTSVGPSECPSDSNVYDNGSEPRSRVVLHVQDLASLMDDLKRAGTKFAKEVEVSAIGKHIQLEDPDGNRIELFEPTTLHFPFPHRIESRRQFVDEWLVPILINLLFLALFVGAMALVLYVPK